MPLSPFLLGLALQLGPNPMGGAIANDDLVRDRPPREQVQAEPAPEAGPDPVSAWLAGCLGTLDEDPARAHAMAQIRRAETTGADRVLANHCLGTAAAQLGMWQDARTAFTAAREETPAAEPRARARFAALAGAAALGGGDAGGAIALLDQAESDARAAKAPLLEAIAASDRARALVALGRGDEALAALENATALAPDRAEGWLLKATLLRRLERLPEAQTAIERAATLAPTNPETALEAGVIAVLAGRDEAARKSWQSVIALAPDGPVATTAKDYLAQIGDAGDTVPAPQEAPEETAKP
ncbi:tetratricopeptide repeat protein [Porphyrobacter sp. AAP82]|uniref:tetratricopeptide repeat protein n=1 Tax=Porphyrobacter sp. AAP82 TaxID=1248917 RepID=UPI001F32CAE0|nr:tetratricopeptide repeat protein [Porphyrobacter sp. AAP82]